MTSKMRIGLGITLIILLAAGGFYYSTTTGTLTPHEGAHIMEEHENDTHAAHTAPSDEQAYIEGMIPHHEEAVASAKEVLARGGTTPAMRELATGIIDAQEKEISDMKAWYKAWYGTEYKNNGSYQPMMRDLSSLSGTALDRAFLEDMIAHHMGALMMTQSVAPSIEHEEVQTLAESIATTQSAEIITMRTLLKQLPAS